VRLCRERGLAVVSAVPGAARVPNRYESTLALERAGALFVRDMLPETALVKLMWALAHSSGEKDIARLMLDPIAEELRA
jgi:L-asparaginase/Glu-tRNA(Gln) amidotransferase subunit D